VRTYRGHPSLLKKFLTEREAWQSITAVTFEGTDALSSLSCLKNLGENLRVFTLTETVYFGDYGYRVLSPLDVRNLCDAFGRMNHLEEFVCAWNFKGTAVIPILANSSPKLRKLVLTVCLKTPASTGYF